MAHSPDGINGSSNSKYLQQLWSSQLNRRPSACAMTSSRPVVAQCR